MLLLGLAARWWRCFFFLAFLHLATVLPLPGPQPSTMAAVSTDEVLPL